MEVDASDPVDPRTDHAILQAALSVYPQSYLMQTWSLFRKFGTLPKSGGFNDQPSRWLDAMNAMTRIYNRHASAALKEWQDTMGVDAPKRRKRSDEDAVFGESVETSWEALFNG